MITSDSLTSYKDNCSVRFSIRSSDSNWYMNWDFSEILNRALEAWTFMSLSAMFSDIIFEINGKTSA